MGAMEREGGTHIMNADSLIFAHVNVCSLTSRFLDFSSYVISRGFTVIAISETWLRPEIPNSVVHIDGYKFYRNDRNGRGGGTGIYIRDNINAGVIQATDAVEQTWISFKIKHRVYIAGVVYRSQRIIGESSFIDTLDEQLSQFVHLGDEIILMGDVNIDLSINGGYASRLRSVFDAYGLVQVIKEPTRVTLGSAKLIDIIAISEVLSGVDSGTEDMTGITDHRLTYCSLPIKVSGEYL